MLPEIKKLVAEIKPHKSRMTVVAITGILNALATARVALLTKVLFDALSANNQQELMKQVPIVIGLGFIQAISRYYHIYNMNYISEAVVTRIREKLQYKFMRLNLSFHNNYAAGSGGLISRILNDIKTIQDGLRVIADIFLYPLLLVGLLINLIIIDWKLTLSVLIIAPVIGIILKSIARSMRKYIPREREALEYMTSTIKESLDGVRVIQSFNLERDMAKKLEDQGANYLSIRKTVYKRQEASGPATEFIATALIPMILIYNSYEIAAGRGTAGNIIGFIASLLMINAPIKKIQEAYVRIQEVVISVRRIFEIIDNPSEVPQTANPVPFPKDWKKIVYKDVSFAYGKDMILKNVNLEINRGEVVALVGASGSGKSTIVNLLERFFDATSGEILIDGVNIRDIGLVELRRNIALVTQDVFLFSDTIEKNIWAGDYNRDREDVQKMAKLANAHDFIMKTPQGYQSRVGDRGNLLSGGEKQRVSIARAMFKDAPVLILDEATSALDTASEIEVQKGLDHLMEGRTALVIAHRLSTIQKADKIVVMRSGEIVEIGTHASLLSLKGEYHNFHSLQHN
ncbi:ABC transporter ATP-binding protein [Bdellovibrio sp. KM01]|uniref:ABC transporter ATP-binding protein n=1 Tax=Bdellovibrio sp. KM01 TaxID=2748865 RepID=UPI0015E9F470|nr:ABC transporter ATP-binding protein [Bdellovibrio sp. KM01]QLY25350.1 ABC transporter ATP-binding protein [Bdellovibrio sp. KM01]